jgi:hypothetical protein
VILRLPLARQGLPEEARAPAPLEIQITDNPSAPARPEPAFVPESPVAAPRRPPVTARSHVRAADRDELAPSEPEPRAPPVGEAPAAPAAGSGGGVAPDLSLRALPPEARARLVGPPPEAELRSRPQRPSLEERRAEIEREEDAIANVRAGRVDPLLFEYLRGARRRFEEDARRLAEGLPLGPRETMRAWGGGYLQHVEDVHRMAAAGKNRDGPASTDPRVVADEPRPDLFAGYDEATRAANAGAEVRRAEICLDVSPGRETTASLRKSSGNAALDRVALNAFARSAAARPVPPDARRGLACYEIRIAAFRMPPLPAIACGWDEKGITCAWPFKRITSVTGHLLSVEYPPPKNAPPNRSLLRSAR